MMRATLDTRKFHFEAYGENKAAACELLIDALRRHAAAYRLPADWFSVDEFDYFEFQLGAAYRDNEVIN